MTPDLRTQAGIAQDLDELQAANEDENPSRLDNAERREQRTTGN
jgi:hypothetical protein